MSSPEKSAPWLAMIDTPAADRYYFIPPIQPGSYSPAISIVEGVIRPCYKIPGHLGVGSIYSEGSEKVCKRHREMLGIRAALDIMGKVWSGVLASHPGAECDIGKQKRLVSGLMGSPEVAFALIEKSGKLGTQGVPKLAADYERNVFALAHWKAIWQLRRKTRSLMVNGSSKPGGIFWDWAAAWMNQFSREVFSDLEERQWRSFTGRTLCDLAERAVILDPKSGV